MASPSSRVQRSKRRAAKAGLVYVNDFDSGITRRRCGRGFTYLSARGKRITSDTTKQRIKSLTIPPAWEDVWICSKPNGHVQARGCDAAGRIQRIYHVEWRTVSEASKFDRMALFAELLPRIRRRVRKDLNRKGLHRLRVIAAVVRLLDKAQLRVGNEQSVELRGARGATTLSSDHVDIDQFKVSLDFPGKSGQRREVEFRDQKVANVIRKCEEIGGQFLFCYRNGDSNERCVDSSDVNDYLKDLTDKSVTAKDFRTWWGTVTALSTLVDLSEDTSSRDRKVACTAAVKQAAETLGNTPAVCKGSYIHPAMLAAAESGELPKLLASARVKQSEAEMTICETQLYKLLSALDFD